MKEDGSDKQQFNRDYYRGKINYEGILGEHINHIALYRDTNTKAYCSSIETFILMCPADIRSKCFTKLKELKLQRGEYAGIKEDKLIVYDDLWIYTNELLEKSDLIFKTGSFETGHD